ncbi:BREX-2 system adenine-specific DNA-methyltransferase PglX [Myxococcus sp. NMCA1]|uniref:BREX-2 system adenine-specific DNA-methyltransferase PglX n=1 Tax=Myxococcus sp. NMCA1 TaxID=2996785 RepID=UPI002285901A|nr:BREX-2 system adenine-specific DNA-methyltransferase PglX [Myxococcus sp. NMCA1]WAM30041.1 BREX-2 system adenine-specific DNA-methyltransferase PglX [Myxococcus sp. NMCA1]
MELEKRVALTKALAKLTERIAEDIREQVRRPGPAQDRARSLHRDERVGEDFIVWTDVLSRRAAVLWVLKTVYVRILEDRGLMRPLRLVNPDPKAQEVESEKLFRHLAPNLGPSAYLAWVFRDLSSARGGLPELFSPQPAEVARPSDARSQELLEFWRRCDVESGDLAFSFDGEQFDGRLMGDLYQDLDPVVKERYALLQTPDFVLDFILDETLTPAITEWGVEKVRVLDPACGSGHFLLAAFKRLVTGMREKFPARPMREVVDDCLARVVGIDLNDYACGLARARLVMTALELAGETDLGAASDYHPQVYWADALEQVERDPELEQMGLFTGEVEKKPYNMLTRPEVRARLRPLLRAGFEVVVGNPPYILERDEAKREYHREKVGRERRYVSAAGKYSLGAPFTERMFQIAVPSGFVGMITANSFMKREFGKALIEKVLPREDLFLVVDTSGAYIPGHGTPTVVLFGRHRRPQNNVVRVVMGKRGEPGIPVDPTQGRVWRSIVEECRTPGDRSEFVSVAEVACATLQRHPWSIGGGGSAELKEALDRAGSRLAEHSSEIGFASFPGADEVFVVPRLAALRLGVPPRLVRTFVPGDAVRDWRINDSQSAIAPYDDAQSVVSETDLGRAREHFWRMRAVVLGTMDFGGSTRRDNGDVEWSWYRWQAARYRIPLSITFGEVATHNHFVLDRGGKVFKQTAPVIKLPPEASEVEHLALLGQLNSSVACFWLKQVCQNKGLRGQGGGITSEAWEQFFQFGGTKLGAYPLARVRCAQVEEFAVALDALARERMLDSVEKCVSEQADAGATALRVALSGRSRRDLTRLYRMVGLQEELDWLCYRLYGIAPELELRRPGDVQSLVPGQRPFEIKFAREDAERRAVLAHGDEAEEAPTAWFERHGWQPVGSLDAIADANERRIIEQRMALTAASRNLGLIEQPTYKRRWHRPDYVAEETQALETYLSDRMEAWVKERATPFTLRQMVAALQSDAGVLAVAECLAGNAQFDLEALLSERLLADSVPNNKHHVFKLSGLDKRAAWEATWEMQRREDAGEKVTPPVPPKYASADYLRPEYWSLRGALDVPKERFITFTELPWRDGPERLYGWAGLTPRQRSKVLVELDEESEGSGVSLADRYGLLYGAQILVPYVASESKEAAAEFDAVVRGLVGKDGVTEKMLAEWAERFPATRPRAARTRRRTA